MHWGRGGGRKHTEMQQRIIARMHLKLLNVLGRADLVAALALAADAHRSSVDTVLLVPDGRLDDVVAVSGLGLEELPHVCCPWVEEAWVIPLDAVDVEVGLDLSDLREDEEGSGEEGDGREVHGGGLSVMGNGDGLKLSEMNDCLAGWLEDLERLNLSSGNASRVLYIRNSQPTLPPRLLGTQSQPNLCPPDLITDELVPRDLASSQVKARHTRSWHKGHL